MCSDVIALKCAETSTNDLHLFYSLEHTNGLRFAPPTYDFGNVFTNFYCWAKKSTTVYTWWWVPLPGCSWSQKTPEMNELESDLRAAKIWVRKLQKFEENDENEILFDWKFSHQNNIFLPVPVQKNVAE